MNMEVKNNKALAGFKGSRTSVMFCRVSDSSRVFAFCFLV
jgi:hypothetical protein